MSSSSVPLGDLVDITSGFAFSSKNFSEAKGTPIIRIRDVARGYTELRFDGNFDKKFLAQNDDLLVSMDGEFRVSEWRGGPALINQRVCKIEPKNGKLDRRFLRHFLPKELKEIEDKTPFVTVKHLSAKTIREIECPNIGIDEQRRIAAILDKADAIRRKRQQALALADDFLKSAYVHLVGHRNPAYADWKPETIEKLAQDKKGAIRSGPFGSALLHSEFVDEGIAVLGIDNAVQNQFAWGQRRFITEEKYEELRRYRVFPGDVIITIMGTTGRSAVVPDDIPEAITTKHLASITCDTSKILPEVLSFAIHSDSMIIRQIKQHNKGAIMDGLNLGIIKKLVLPKPPMKLQQRFAEALRSVSKHKEQISSELGDGTELFASLSQRAFRGEL